MPRLKEVDSLQELADRVLLSSVVQCCRQFCTPEPHYLSRFLSISTDGSALKLTELREAIAAVREQILNRMPPNLLAEFSNSFMNEYYSLVRYRFEGEAVLEMIMDIEIVGLRLTGRIVRYLTSDDAPRLRRLKELDLSDVWSVNVERLPVILGNLYLNDLTLFRYPKHCTDSDLEIIGRNCPNLEVLDVNYSRDVTDAGLRFLSSCPNLRVVNVDRCPKVTHVSLSFLLSDGYKKFQDFSYGNHVEYTYVETRGGCTGPRQIHTPSEFDMLSGLDFTVKCPSLTRFVYANYRQDSLPVELKAIVTKFPNLTSLRIECFIVEDLSAVKTLDNLTELNIIFYGMEIRNRTWLSFQEALTVIGANLTALTLQGDSSWGQGDVNFIFDSCPNLEYLHIDDTTNTLVIPPFPKLKELNMFHSLRCCDVWNIPRTEPVLEFGIMLNLEILSIRNMRIDFIFLESMMLDNIKFPKLRVVKINSVKSVDLAKIEQTARENNLDFCSRNDAVTLYCYQEARSV